LGAFEYVLCVRRPLAQARHAEHILEGSQDD